MNRQKIGAIIFNDEVKRKVLNGIIHPAIRQEMLRQRDEHVENGEKQLLWIFHYCLKVNYSILLRRYWLCQSRKKRS